MEPIAEKAYAKINPVLKVTGVDERGYHLLDTVMMSVGLCDDLVFSPRADGEITLRGPGWLKPDESNTIIKAARLLEALGRMPGADITLTKRIPAKAGMAGGSADAAAALRGLCRLWGIEPGGEELRRMALGIGADVPFTLLGGMARARGVGEVLCPLEPVLDIPILCVKPREGLSTPVVFKRYDGMAKSAAVDVDAFLRALYARDWQAMRRHGGNDLQAPAIDLCPKVGRLLREVDGLGAAYSVMTGSGTAVIGMFQEEQAAHLACGAFKNGEYFARVVWGVAPG